MNDPKLPATRVAAVPVFEETDANTKLVVLSLASIAGTLLLALVITIILQKHYETSTPIGDPNSTTAPARIIPSGPKLEVHPWESLPEMRAHEDQILNSYGRDQNGHVHIPIDKAMDLALPSLTVRPDSPLGLTTPGGLGRDFTGSISTYPPTYQGPQIQGEVEKHAQQ